MKSIVYIAVVLTTCSFNLFAQDAIKELPEKERNKVEEIHKAASSGDLIKIQTLIKADSTLLDS